MSFISKNIKALQKSFRGPDTRSIGRTPSRADASAKGKKLARRRPGTRTIFSSLGEPGASENVIIKKLLGT